MRKRGSATTSDDQVVDQVDQALHELQGQLNYMRKKLVEFLEETDAWKALERDASRQLEKAGFASGDLLFSLREALEELERLRQ